MKKWLLLLILSLTLTTVLSAAMVRVAVLPLKRLDSASKYIQKFLTIRDLKRSFDLDENFDLLNMKDTEFVFKELAFEDVDEMDKEDMAEIGKELKADVVIIGVISSVNPQLFSIQFRFYSMRTDDIVSQRIDVVKDKRRRWAVLDKDFMGKLNSFFNQELEKLNNIAVQDYRAENYAQAERGFNNILSYDPNNKQAYYYLGLIAYQAKNYSKAISDFNKALSDSITVKDSNVLQSLTNAYRDSGDKENTIRTLEILANLQEDEELWLSVANLYAENNQNQKAKEALLKALDVDPDFVKAKYRMAFLLYDMAQYDEAIPYLEKAANDYPDNDLFARRLAVSYQRSGRISEAMARYENIIATNPTNTLAYLNLAGLYRTAAAEASEANNQALVNENNQKALNTLNKLKEVDPENPLVYLRFADVYLASNRYNDAESNANLALSKDSSLYQPYIILASINQRRGSDSYNQFIDLDKQFQTAYGRRATQIGNDRDAARTAANNYFRRAEDQLKSAKSRTNEPEVISDIDGKLTTLAQLITQTSRIN